MYLLWKINPNKEKIWYNYKGVYIILKYKDIFMEMGI